MKLLIPLLTLSAFLWLCNWSLERETGYPLSSIEQLNRMSFAAIQEPMTKAQMVIYLWGDDGRERP